MTCAFLPMSPENTSHKEVIGFNTTKFVDILRYGMGDIATKGKVKMLIYHGILNPTKCPRTNFSTFKPCDFLRAFRAIKL